METYTVKEVAARFGVSAHTIRYYDNEGLLPETQRDANGARLFTDEQLDWLGIVLCLRATGLSVAGIRDYIALSARGDETLRERYAILCEQKRRAEEERAEIDRKLALLDKKLTKYEARMRAAGAPKPV